MTRRQLITGEESAENLSQRISQLESQRSSLESQAGDSISQRSPPRPRQGTLSSSVDGLESAVDVEDVENLTVAQVEELLSLGRHPGQLRRPEDLPGLQLVCGLCI